MARPPINTKRAKSRSKYQECPICATIAPMSAERCVQCGAALRGSLPVEAPPKWVAPSIATPVRRAVQPSSAVGLVKQQRGARGRGVTAETAIPHDSAQFGHDDFVISAIPRRSANGLFAVTVGIIVVSLFGALLFYFQSNATRADNSAAIATGTAEVLRVAALPTATPARRSAPQTNTPVMFIPTLALATVTPAPPTPTSEPTRGPCLKKASAGDTVLSLAIECGHKSMDVIALILRVNNMESANQLQLGQSLEIPYPTPVGGSGSSTTSNAAAAASGSSGGDPLAALSEPTLPPGVQWHTIVSGETALSVVAERGITMRILQDLNPEIKFEQCDFGLQSGGPACTVLLYENQRVRVPAPLPTPTPTITPNGSETPMPTMTATFNAPSSASPDNNMLFEAVDLPTLRWVATGQLAANEIYLVVVNDQTQGKAYTYATRDLSFQLPADWQPADSKPHTFEWYVVISKLGANNTAIPGTYATERRVFTWMNQ